MNLFLIVDIHDHFYQLTKYIDTLYLTLDTFRCHYLISDIRQLFVQVLVCLLLIFQAAHQTTADT